MKILKTKYLLLPLLLMVTALNSFGQNMKSLVDKDKAYVDSVFWDYGMNASKYQPRTEIELNDRLIIMEEDINLMVEQWKTQLLASRKTNDYKPVTAIRKELELLIRWNLMVVVLIRDFNDSENFRKAFLEWLKTERQMVQTEFVKFESLTENTSNDELMAMGEKLIEASEVEQKLQQKIAEEQAIFAQKNGLKLAPPAK